MKEILAERFKQKTALEWENLLFKFDTCVTVVRSPLNLSKNYIHPFMIPAKL